MRPTDEQQAAIDGFATGDNMTIEAGAGTGKTSTLRYLADQAQGRTGLYLAYNKAIQQEAARKFAGTNVQARTANSVAFATHGRPLAHKLQGQRRMKPSDQAKVIGLSRPIGLDRDRIPKHVATRTILSAVTNFCHSQDAEVSEQHVELPDTIVASEEEKQDLRGLFSRYAQYAWRDMADPSGQLPVSHDVYTKLWSLDSPQLGVDFILFDEAQDAAADVTAVMKAQQGAQIVAVGDRAQAIYGWRGATNSMDEFGGSQFQLTRSFRFGAAIADEANVWLSLLGSTMRLTGSDKPSSVHASLYRVPEAVLCRTNAGVIAEIILAHQVGVPVSVPGAGRLRQVRTLAQSAYDLQNRGWTRHPALDMFDDWQEVLDFVDENEDSEIVPLVKLVETYGAAELMEAIDQCVPAEQARTVVSTAHGAKGLEWKHVRIGDDFFLPKFDHELEVMEPLDPAELMLSYVAVTRAQRHLDPSGLEWVRSYRDTLARGGDMGWKTNHQKRRAEARKELVYSLRVAQRRQPVSV